MQLQAHLHNLLAEATDFQVRSIAAQLFDKDGKPRSSFLADPKGRLRQAFAKATATEKKSKRNLSADAKQRAGFDQRLKQYEKALQIARAATGVREKRARKPVADPGRILKFPEPKAPGRRPPAAAAVASGGGTTPFRLVASVQHALAGLRLLVEDR